MTSFERFPGVGRRTAERLAFHVLRDTKARELAGAIDRAVRDTLRCESCGNVTEHQPCSVCADTERDWSQVLVVEEPRDVEAVERSRAYRGLYHVLMGALQPAGGVEPAHLAVAPLLERLKNGVVTELILGTDADAEGEATARLLLQEVERSGVQVAVTRLARGVPAGSALEYLHRGVIEDALEGRIQITGRPRST